MDDKRFETSRGVKELKQLLSVWNFHQIEIGIENVCHLQNNEREKIQLIIMFYSIIIKLNQHLKTISLQLAQNKI